MCETKTCVQASVCVCVCVSVCVRVCVCCEADLKDSSINVICIPVSSVHGLQLLAHKVWCCLFFNAINKTLIKDYFFLKQ